MHYTVLTDLYRADSKPGVQHRDNVQENKHQSVAKKYGEGRCDTCGGQYKTTSLHWLTRDKRICLKCRLENEKMRRSLIQMKRGA